MRKFDFAALAVSFFVSGYVHAQSVEMCDQYMNIAVGLDEQAPARVKDGAFSVDEKSDRYISRTGDQAKIKMAYHLAAGAYVFPTDVRFSKTEKGEVVISRRADPSQKFHAHDLTGFETRFDVSKSGQCEVVQNVAVFGGQDKDARKVVFDRKYCDAVRAIIAKQGNEKEATAKLKVCTDVLGDIKSAFDERQAELRKDRLELSDSLGAMSSPSISRGSEATASTMLGLMALCSPHDWHEMKMEVFKQQSRTSRSSSGGRETSR